MARGTYGLVKQERNARTSMPLRQKIEMGGHGYFAESAAIYDFPRNDRREYLSDYQHLLRCSRINAWGGCYGHKLTLRSYLLALGFPQAETAATVMRDRILIDPYRPGRSSASRAALLERLRDGDEQGYIGWARGGCTR